MDSDNEKPRKKKRRPHWIVRGLGPSFTACMGFVISVLYITFPCAWLATHVSVAYPVASAMLLTGTLVTFLVSSFMDPGILHQGTLGTHRQQSPSMHHYLSFHKSCSNAEQGKQLLQGPPWPGTAEVAYVIVNGQRYDMDWCSRCEIYLPPAAWHCRRCNACVDEPYFEPDDKNPFDQGCWKNWTHVLCSPTGPRYLGAVKPSSRGDTEGDWSSLTLLHQEDQCLYSCSSVPCCNTCKHHQVAVGPASPGHFKHSTLSLDSLKEGRGCCCCYREVVPAGCVTTDKHSDNNKPPQSSAVEIPDMLAAGDEDLDQERDGVLIRAAK